MTTTCQIDDHLLACYRELMDAEDAAFDELEHAYEEGTRERFEADFAAWQGAIAARVDFLRRHGLAPASLDSVAHDAAETAAPEVTPA